MPKQPPSATESTSRFINLESNISEDSLLANMHRISRRKWLAQSSALILAGDSLFSLRAAEAGPLRTDFNVYRVRVDTPSPFRLKCGNLELAQPLPLGDFTACISDLPLGYESYGHFYRTFSEAGPNGRVYYEPTLLYWFCVFLRRGDVVICYDGSDTCRVASIAGSYSFNTKGPDAHVRPLALFPSTIPCDTLRGAFTQLVPQRPIHEASCPEQWIDTSALSALENLLGTPLQPRAKTEFVGSPVHTSWRLDKRKAASWSMGVAVDRIDYVERVVVGNG